MKVKGFSNNTLVVSTTHECKTALFLRPMNYVIFITYLKVFHVLQILIIKENLNTLKALFKTQKLSQVVIKVEKMFDVRVWYTMFLKGRFIIDLYIFTPMVGSHKDLLGQKKVLTQKRRLNHKGLTCQTNISFYFIDFLVGKNQGKYFEIGQIIF